MNSKSSLIIGRGIFTILVIVALGLIIVNEKGGELFKTKADEKIMSYLQSNYNDLIKSTNQEETTYKDSIFTKKVISKSNKNLYFYIKYHNKEITDTFKTDYEEGTTLLDYLNTKLEKEIKKETNIDCNVYSLNKLNKYSEKVQERIIKEDNLLQLRYFYISKEIQISNWNKEDITKEITSFIKAINDKGITPKYYEIIITNEEDITTSIKITNITENFLEINNKEQIIEDILNNKDTKLLKENKITFEYEN